MTLRSFDVEQDFEGCISNAVLHSHSPEVAILRIRCSATSLKDVCVAAKCGVAASHLAALYSVGSDSHFLRDFDDHAVG